MTLRRKTFFVIGITLAAFVLLLYGASRLILLRSYRQLEADSVVEDTERVVKSIDDNLDQLSRTTVDWAYWDDTYDFVLGNYDEYVADNLATDTLVNLGLNFTIYQDNDGRVVFSKFIDLEAEEETPPSFTLDEETLSLLAPDPQDLLGGATGIFKVNGHPILVASRHILGSQNEGPSEGTLIFGLYLNEAKIVTLEETLNSDFEFYDLDDPTLSPAIQTIAASLETSSRVEVQPVNGESVSGYHMITDVSGRPSYLLKVNLPRTLYQQGLATLQLFLVNLILFGLAVIVVTLLLMNRMVLERLGRLHAGVMRIRGTDDLSLLVEASGEDEIAGLGQVLNDLFGEVEESRKQLRSFNLALESRVAKRTEDLAKVNEALQEEVVERQQTQIQLAAARDQAMEALRLKTQILANVSHDVRTPLNVITLRCEMLLHENGQSLNPRQKKLMETVLFSAGELLHFFNNLLEQSQSQEKAIKITNSPFSPREFIEDVERLSQPLAENKGLSLQCEVDPALPRLILGDEERLKQILANLVDNAIKFTEHGGVVVQLGQKSKEQWAIIVTDTGPGIAEKNKDLIFDAFWQADGSPTRRVNRGVGLGLSIVKQLVLLMGGEVSVISEGCDKGSTFVVTLPLQNGEE
ncbi:MAG: CHASE4 domain-containing protein [Candidatus Promineifilaceae bacterium]